MELSFIVVLGVVIGAFGLMSALLAVMHKRHYLVHCALALYITTAIVSVMPQRWVIDAFVMLWVIGGVFVVTLLVGPSLFWAVDEWSDYRVPWRFMIFGVAVFGMAISIILPFALGAGIGIPWVGADVLAVFTDSSARFAWMVAPVVVAVVMRRI